MHRRKGNTAFVVSNPSLSDTDIKPYIASFNRPYSFMPFLSLPHPIFSDII